MKVYSMSIEGSTAKPTFYRSMVKLVDAAEHYLLTGPYPRHLDMLKQNGVVYINRPGYERPLVLSMFEVH